MTTKRIVIDRLYKRKRVDITPQNYLKRFRLYLFLHITASILGVAFIMYQFGVNFTSFGLSVAIVLTVTAISYYFMKRTKSVAIKGDTLILNSFNKRSCVTSLRSVKRVSTSTFLGVQCTRLSYKLDGVTRYTFVINRSWAVPSTPERLIKKAILLSKKKKANHKLGPVSLATD